MEVKVRCNNCRRITIIDYGEMLNGKFLCICGSRSGIIIYENEK